MATFKNENLLIMVFKHYKPGDRGFYSRCLLNGHILTTLLRSNTLVNTRNPLGVNLFEQGKYIEALPILTQNAEIDGTDTHSLYYQGACMYYLAKYMEALVPLTTIERTSESYLNSKSIIEKCRSMLSGEYKQYDIEAKQLYRSEDYQAAIELFSKALLINPYSIDIYCYKAKALAKLSMWNPALDCYNDAIGLASNNPNYYCKKAKLLMKMYHHDEALEYYDLAITINPDKTDSYYHKGKACIKLNQYDEAIFLFDWALSINPEKAEVYNAKGMALAEVMRYEEAVDAYDLAISFSKPTGEYYFNKANVLRKMLNYEQAYLSYEYGASISKPNERYREEIMDFCEVIMKIAPSNLGIAEKLRNLVNRNN
jgi:tetratricopeptide (TPR) repeat protein